MASSQAAILEQLKSSKTKSENSSSDNVNSVLIAEMQDQIDQIHEDIDNMPVISGYLDVEYFNDDKGNSPGEFRNHHLSLHISQEFESLRFFSEVEWEYGAKFEGDGGTALEEARGEIKMEQGWGEWIVDDLLTLRVGLILTPGYWNVNHYPQHVLSTRRPLMVRKVFPESFVGVMGYGTKYWNDFGITYEAWISNGESPFFTKNDDSENKAFGGRLHFDIPIEQLDSLGFGIRASAEDPSVGSTDIWGLEAQMSKGPFGLLAEYAIRNGTSDRDGLYVQPSLELDDKWTLFYRFDQLNIDGGDDIEEHTVGVNYKLRTNASLKLEFYTSEHSTDEDFNGIVASMAIEF